MRAGGGALVAAILLLSVLAPGASAAGGVTLKVNEGATPHYLSEDQLRDNRDVRVDKPATLRSPHGSSIEPTSGGTSLALLLQLAHIPPDSVRTVSIARTSTSGEASVDAARITGGFDGDPLGGGARFATVFSNGSSVRFFRPLKDDADFNSDDKITTSENGDLPMSVTTTNNALRDVVIHADDTSPDPGVDTGFLAHVTDPPDGVTFSYSWDWGDGETTDGPSASHTFAKGAYHVTVTANGDDDSSGVAYVDIQVGKPSVSPTPEPSNGKPGPGGGGPAGGGEGDPKDPTSGPNKSRSHGQKKKTKKSKVKRETTAASTPTPAPPTVTPGPGTGTTLGSGLSTSTPGTIAGGARGTPRKSRAASPPPSSGAPALTGRGERVDGIVLASAGSAADVIASVRAAEQEHAPARRGGGGDGTVLGWLGGSGVLVVLLGLGAVREGGLRWRARSI